MIFTNLSFVNSNLLSHKNNCFSYNKIAFFSLLLWTIRGRDISRLIKLTNTFSRTFLDSRKLALHWCSTYILSNFVPMSHQFDISLDMLCNNWHCFNTVNPIKAYSDGFVKKCLLGRGVRYIGSHFLVPIFPTSQI